MLGLPQLRESCPTVRTGAAVRSRRLQQRIWIAIRSVWLDDELGTVWGTSIAGVVTIEKELIVHPAPERRDVRVRQGQRRVYLALGIHDANGEPFGHHAKTTSLRVRLAGITVSCSPSRKLARIFCACAAGIRTTSFPADITRSHSR
jgi:hypothetical protein